MTSKREPIVDHQLVKVVDGMLKRCAEAHLTVAGTLRAGVSEREVAASLTEELAGAGIADFWYDIPIVVLFGRARFQQLADNDYAVKRPSNWATLRPGDPFFVDIHPRHPGGQWGNFAASGLYQPVEPEAVKFMEEMLRIQRAGISHFTADMTGGDIARWFNRRFAQLGISLLDVRGNHGHSMGRGSKAAYSRHFLDEENTAVLEGQVYGIEPGGTKVDITGRTLVARFEDCVYFPPHDGRAILLGRQEPVPLVFG